MIPGATGNVLRPQDSKVSHSGPAIAQSCVEIDKSQTHSLSILALVASF